MKRLAKGALYLVSFLGLAGCNQSGGDSAPAKSAAAPAAIPPYTYPAPVKGKYSEVNSGKFDLVDGVAYAADKDTVVYVTEKPIASPVLAGSACSATQARSMALLRNSGYIRVKLNAAGNPTYYEAGTARQGARIDRAGRTAKASGGKPKDGRIAGSITDQGHGKFDFDLPVASDSPAAAPPTKDQLYAAYKALRAAAIKKDVKGVLAAQGFDAKQIEKIRGLDSIDADAAALADLFLEPGTAEDMTTHPSIPGAFGVGAKGTNPKGAKFFNYYWFVPCGDKFLLVKVADNPQ